jgi:hypothetical protein
VPFFTNKLEDIAFTTSPKMKFWQGRHANWKETLGRLDFSQRRSILLLDCGSGQDPVQMTHRLPVFPFQKVKVAMPLRQRMTDFLIETLPPPI